MIIFQKKNKKCKKIKKKQKNKFYLKDLLWIMTEKKFMIKQ